MAGEAPPPLLPKPLREAGTSVSGGGRGQWARPQSHMPVVPEGCHQSRQDTQGCPGAQKREGLILAGRAPHFSEWGPGRAEHDGRRVRGV